MELANIARVAVSAATYTIDKPYDYLIPEKLLHKVRPGVRVTVPFGRGNKTSEGFVLTVGQDSKRGGLKAVGDVLDDESVLGAQQIKLALWLRERYFCTLYNAVKVLLPAGLWYRIREVCTLAVSREEALEAGANERECRVLEALAAHGGSAELERMRELFGSETVPALNALQNAGLVWQETAAARKVSDKTRRMADLAVSAEEALAQIDTKDYLLPFKADGRKLIKIGANFDSTKRTLASWIIQEN